MVKTRRKWSDNQKARALAYYAEHGFKAAMEKFGITGSSMLGGWKKDAELVKLSRQIKPTGAAAHHNAHRKMNGATPPPADRAQLALKWLERWKNAQRAHIRRGGVDSPYDINVEHAYRTLRGEEE